jgi:hypothetical protein
MLGWAVVVFIIVAGVAALLAFVTARDATSIPGNALAYAAGVVLTGVGAVLANMLVEHSLRPDLAQAISGLPQGALVAPFVGAAFGLWWARQYRLGR